MYTPTEWDVLIDALELTPTEWDLQYPGIDRYPIQQIAKQLTRCTLKFK